MLNVRFIVKMLGMMFILETVFMLAATAVAFFYKGDDLYPLLQSSGILFGTGILFASFGRHANEYRVGRREGMLVVSLTWILFSFFGMLPFYLSGYIDNVTDAYFETMSGFTTMGATILTDVESLPHGLLFWRSLTQWQGGIGVIVFSVALLPIFGVGATQMFNAETSGIIHRRFRPRITQVAKRIWGIYLLLTLVLAALLCAGPMNLFDAVNHALSGISTGGFSTKNTSIAFWNSAYTEYVLCAFMLIGATNFSLIYFLLKGKPKKLFADEETRWFYGFMFFMTALSTVWVFGNGFIGDFEETFRKALFQVCALITSTGFTTVDYLSWGPFFWLLALLMMAICGCSGSTSGGLKMQRFVVLVKNLSNEYKKQTHPNAVIPVRINKHALSDDTVHRVLAFVFAYIALIISGCIVLMFDGVPFEDTIGATVSCISNVGPGLGELGPAGNYSSLPDLSKWTLSFLMMVGRLEIFTVLTILQPGFWKQ